jgi:hypothetical protein
MSRKVRSVIVVEAVAIALITGVQAALAAPKGYIDPSTGGMLFQVLAVIVTMASGLVFLFSNKIKMLFRRGGSTESAADDGNMLLTQMDDVTTGSDDEDEKPATALK